LKEKRERKFPLSLPLLLPSSHLFILSLTPALACIAYICIPHAIFDETGIREWKDRGK